MNPAPEGRFGKLYLMPAPLDFGCDNQTPLQAVMPTGTLQVAARLEYWITENAKSTRAYLKRVGEVEPLSFLIQSLQIQELPREVHKKGDHQIPFDAQPILGPALSGHDIGLVSEAGMPAVADPGASVVRSAHVMGIEVVPLVGPASLLLALAASGLNGQNFAFVGYLPQDAHLRSLRIKELESLALKSGQTQIFIETPYRNTVLLQALLKTLENNTRLAVCSGLTLETARVKSLLNKDWKRIQPTLDNNTPAVFALGR